MCPTIDTTPWSTLTLEVHPMRRALAFLTVGTLGATLVYRILLYERVRDWGARPDEVARRLPGDDLLADAAMVSTRAITIDAPASAIWPWLIQMGPGRAGAYTYDWIENLFGLDMHSADEIVPRWQSMQVGDAWRLGKDQALRAEIVEPGQALVVRSQDGGWVWAFVLAPEGEATRLLSRNRMVVKGGALAHLAMTYLMVPGSLVMERKMLLGIRNRAEKLAREHPEGERPIAAGPGPAAAPGPAEPGGLVAGPRLGHAGR